MEAIDTKIKILQGAAELFMRYGIRSVSMDNIANHLGVSKKTLYQYFKDKDEMVLSVTKAHIAKDQEELDQIGKTAKNSIEELVKLSRCLRENFRDMNPSLLFDLEKYHREAWNVWLDYKNNFIKDQIQRSLIQGKEEGYFRAEVNTNVMAIMRIETIQLAFDPSLFPKDQYELTDVQMQIFEHFIYGIFTYKGRKLYEKYKEKLSNAEKSTMQL
ncbi:MAG TPA: TetR/AcrR family transcriptional regulator [Cyclobacteriaceae bacterium]